MVAFQLDIVEILFHGPHMIACCALRAARCALGDVRQPLQHRVVDPRMLAIDLLFLLWSMVEIIYAGKHELNIRSVNDCSVNTST